METECKKINLPDKNINPIQVSTSSILSEPNKSYSQTIVQGNYKFYNPNPQREIEHIKNTTNYVSNKNTIYNHSKNYEGKNKNNDSQIYYNKEHILLDKNYSYYKVLNNIENCDNIKSNQSNSHIKHSLESMNSNKDKVTQPENNPSYQINNKNFKKINNNKNKTIREDYSENIINYNTYNPLSKIRTMNIKEVKEFIPKNFVIINKDNKLENEMKNK